MNGRSALGVTLAVAFLTLITATGCASRPALSAPSPATITIVDVQGGKPPEMLYTLKLDLVNRSDKPAWFLFAAEDALFPEDDQIVPDAERQIELGAGKLSSAEREPFRENVKSPCVEFFGIHDELGDLVACRLPAGATWHVPDWGVDSSEQLREYHVWQADQLLVNGKSPLEDWIGSRVISQGGTYATHTPANDDPESPGEIRHDAARLDVDRIDFLSLKRMQRWRVPIANIDAALRQPD